MTTDDVPTYPDLRGKVAVVTGGSKGIGAETCRLLAGNGVHVAVGGRDEEAVDRVVEGIRADGGSAVGVLGDVNQLATNERMRDRAEEAFGPVDILLPFAGGFGAYTPVWEATEEDWRFVMDANTTSTFFALRAFLPGMIERRRGAIVAMSSCAARVIDAPVTAAYAASKAAITTLTRHAALEVGQFGIRVNCIAPATTRSERIDAIVDAERMEAIAAMSPLGRMGLPRDSANAAVFLASEAASWLTGVTLDVAGGRVMM